MRNLFTLTAALTLGLNAIAGTAGSLPAFTAREQVHVHAPVKVPAKLPGAFLGEAPLYDPEGSDENYVMNVVENSWMGEMACYGYKMTVRRSADGKKIYFRDLTPGYNIDETTGLYGWVEGTINGNDISIKSGQILYDNHYFVQTLYLEAVTMDEFGQFMAFLPEIHFTINDDVISQPDNSIYLSPYKDGETMDEAGFFNFMNNFSIMPIGEIPTFTPPADAKTESWVMSHANGQQSVTVARDGNTVYIAGLSDQAPDDFVPGTIEDGKLTFKSYYILSSNPNCYQRLAGAVESEPDEFGNTMLEMTPNFSFDVNADGSFTLSPSDSWIVTCDYFLQGLQSGFTGVRMFPYAGDVAATPATPEITFWSAGDMMLQVNVPCEDVDGNYINPEKLAYRIYLDGELHTFTPESYTMLQEPMTDIPYNFTEYYDIYSNGNTKSIYLHADEARQVKVESVYTVDGETRTSAPAELASVAAGITEKTVVDTVYTDLTGRIVKHPSHGAILLKTTRYDDGTRTVNKEIIR